ncbi:hypothetical protein LXL04_002978 [Taraxacum kok-saghyz]
MVPVVFRLPLFPSRSSKFEPSSLSSPLWPLNGTNWKTKRGKSQRRYNARRLDGKSEISHHNLAHTQSNVHFSPSLFYLRIHIIEAQDLLHVDRTLLPEFYVRIVLRSQIRTTIRYEELMVVASEPFDEFLIISVEDRIGPWKDE